MVMSDYPDIIYHYCSTDSFLKIIESKSMWLSAATCLSDYAEIIWIDRKINDAIQALKNESNEEQIRKLLHLYELNSPMPFVAAFSEYGDTLSQWRAYADDGSGVAIGFNPRYFDFKQTVPLPNISPEYSLGLSKVIYNDKEQTHMVRSVISSYLKALAEEDADEGNLLINATMTLRRLSCIFKNAAFKEEVEWRIIHTPLIPGDGTTGNTDIIGGVSDLKFRSASGRLVPYFELSFAKRKGDQSPIVHIVLGPKNESNHADVTLFLSLNGLQVVKISRSAATYR